LVAVWQDATPASPPASHPQRHEGHTRALLPPLAPPPPPGRILKLTADSGHYRPNFANFMGMVQLLRDWGADLSATKLSAKHIDCPL
jgi:hypothetical protein